MKLYNNTRKKLLEQLNSNISSDEGFQSLAMEIFLFQYNYNPIYKRFVDLLEKNVENIRQIEEVPFLPISFYKNNLIKTGEWEAQKHFYSSSTTSIQPSINEVYDLDFYLKNTLRCFESTIGPILDYKWYGLLPSYLERQGSSLVYMAEHFMNSHKNGRGGFFLNDHEKLIHSLASDQSGRKQILLGVSFALLDLARKKELDLHNVIIMETGGMKGREKEIPRAELHDIFQRKFNVHKVWSEYGMTELMSQAYSQGDGVFSLPDTMDILISDLNDPREFLAYGKQGKINIIDLANIDTCSFIVTDDLGIKINSNQFKILGRADDSEMRGCNLLVAD